METSRLGYLFNKYIQHQCSVSEEEELMALIADQENEQVVKDLVDKVIKSTENEIEMPDGRSSEVLKNILQHTDPGVIQMSKRNLRRIFRSRGVAVAIFVLFIAGFAYWKGQYSDQTSSEVMVSRVVDSPSVILPGRDVATLIMADGSEILLDSTGSQVLAVENGVKIKKDGGALVYSLENNTKDGKPLFNTLSTPRGGQFQISLPDGSRVWLNAASTLRYPVVFSGKYRDVELSGEAYFEVVSNGQKPFRVKAGESRVEVLGTHFNVNAYPDEAAIETSLLEGKVKVEKGIRSEILLPGQQAVLPASSKEIKKAYADVESVVAWKNGIFQFDGDDIAGIMRQIGRWYDVEVTFPDYVPVRHFEGKISRRAGLAEVLHILELSGVEFKVDGKKIMVR